MKSNFRNISINPKVCYGRPVIKGTRIPVHRILDLLASGLSTAEIAAKHRTSISEQDVLGCIHYASALVKNRYRRRAA
jgi:uncharacterized protein (DUF433 family)